MFVKKYVWISLIIWSSLLTGCSFVKDLGVQDSNEPEKATLGLDPEFNYEVPNAGPNILVSQSGYEIESRKIAVFRGENLPQQFEIVDARSGLVVYTGNIAENGYNETLKEYNSYGEFDDLAAAGTYYIQASRIGRSYDFTVEEEIFKPVFDEACKEYYINRCGMTLVSELAGDAAHSACHSKAGIYSEERGVTADVSGGWHMDENSGKDILKGSQVITNLLLAYELYPSAFYDDAKIPESGNHIPDILDEVKYEIDWMLKMQDSKTGGIYSAVVVSGSDPARQESYIQPVTLEATAAFSAVMAKFSYFYQTYDEDFATECIRAADRAWKFLEKGRNGQEINQRFFAASELYRATGYRQFRVAAEEYLNNTDSFDLMDDNTFWGCVTYLSTKQKVDLDICDRIMKQLMELAEGISGQNRDSQYFAAVDHKEEDSSRLIHRTVRLVVVDHVISNHEYETVIQNHFYYLAGRNPEGISYVSGLGNGIDSESSKGSIMNHYDLNAEMIVMLSEIVAQNE